MRTTTLALACASLLAACGGGDSAADTAAAFDTTTAAAPAGDTAAGAGGVTATMRDSAGRELGSVTLTETAQGIAIAGTLRGLPPGEHGFHLHTTGQCTPTFEAAGGHWNPTGTQHGSQNPQGPHLGDMPNVTVGADSSVTIQTTTPGGTLRGTNALLDADGAAVMVHATADDNRTDPSGAAGGRVACGAVSGS